MQERLVAERGASDDARGDRREHDHAERLRREVAQDQLHREEHTGQWRVEGRRDAAGRAAGDQHPHPRLGQPDQLAHRGTERGADLHDRSFATDGSATADAQRGRQRLDRRHLRGDPPAAAGNGVHDFGDAVPAGFPGEEMHQRPVHEPGRDRSEQDEPPAQRGDVRVGDMTEAGVIAVAGQGQRERRDQPPERHRTRTRPGAYKQRQSEQAAVRRSQR